MIRKTKAGFLWDDSRIAFAIIIITSTVTGILVILRIYFPSSDQGRMGDIIISAVFGISLGIAASSGRIWIKLIDATKLITNASARLDVMAEAAIAQTKEYKIRDIIRGFSPIPKRSAGRLMTHYYNSINVGKNYISLDTHNTAVLFNMHFWRELAARQDELHKSLSKEDKKVGKGVIRVTITHKASIDFWRRDDAGRALDRQGDFVDAGGHITRIVQGTFSYNEVFDNIESVVETSIEDEDDSLTRYRKIISRMLRKHIEVLYVVVKINEVSKATDFLIVDMKEDAEHADMAMIWHLKDDIIIKCDLIIDGSRETDDADGDYQFAEDINVLTDEWNSLMDTYKEQDEFRNHQTITKNGEFIKNGGTSSGRS